MTKFENITVKLGEKFILHNVFGEVNLSLMAPSGVVETTWMDIQHEEMKTRINGVQMDDARIQINNQESYKRSCSQEDIFLSHFTVKQSSVDFAGDLLIPDILLPKEKRRDCTISKDVDDLHLNKYLSRDMGGGIFSSSCSRGETKRRRSIAVELIRNPVMEAMMPDEPTFGLNTTTATSLIRRVRDLSFFMRGGV